MTDLLRKMEAIVRNDCKLNIPGYCDISMYSYVAVNGNVEAHFIVNGTPTCLWLYGIIYFQESEMFRVFRYRLEDTFDVNDLDY